jgi:hypothetical protein
VKCGPDAASYFSLLLAIAHIGFVAKTLAAHSRFSVTRLGFTTNKYLRVPKGCRTELSCA